MKTGEYEYRSIYRDFFPEDSNWGVAVYYTMDDHTESIETTYRGTGDGEPYWDVSRRNVPEDEVVEVLGELTGYEDELSVDGEGDFYLTWKAADGKTYTLRHNEKNPEIITIEEEA
jgi:hypothetical protein